MTSLPLSSLKQGVSPVSLAPIKTDSRPDSQLLGGELELRVSASSVGVYPSPPPRVNTDQLATQALTPQPPPTTASQYIRLLSGPLADFLEYSQQENAKWLIDIAHDICDPRVMRGSLFVWDVESNQWLPVSHTDPLTAAVYLYRVPDGVVVGLSKISGRAGKSVTAATGNASTMADRVKRRDGNLCWVTRSRDPLINSHVCPKRMGDHLARTVYHTFSPSSSPLPNLSIYDERFGISLSRTLDAYFDKYQLGLRAVGTAGSLYAVHLFAPLIPDCVYTVFGVFPAPSPYPLMHGHMASPPFPHLTNNPTPGLIRWHYLQCVVAKFGHDDYRGLQNIWYSEIPLPMEGDSDEEGTDSEADWPSAALDRGRALQSTMEDALRTRNAITEWITTV